MITASIELVLLFIAALQLKHFICDGPLQTRAMVEAKGHYGVPRGLLHAFFHGLATAVVLAGFGFAVREVMLLALLDMIIHYHVDFTKENIVRMAGWTPSQAPFWWALSADQMAHQLTYLLITYLVFTP